MLILQGQRYQPDRVLPYAPLLGLLRARFTARSVADIADDLGPAAHELVKLFPELATHLPDLTPTPALNPEQEKSRLFQAMIEFFARLAARTPLLVILEDLRAGGQSPAAMARGAGHGGGPVGRESRLACSRFAGVVVERRRCPGGCILPAVVRKSLALQWRVALPAERTGA